MTVKEFNTAREQRIQRLAGISRINGETPRTQAMPENRTHFYPTMELILWVVSEFYGVPIVEIQGPSRMQHIALARQVAAYIARKRTMFSLKHISRMVGRSDHTTIMHAERRIGERIRKEAWLSEQVACMSARITEALHA